MTPQIELIKKHLDEWKERKFPKELARKEARRIVKEELDVTDDYFFSDGREEMAWVKYGMGWGYDHAANNSAKLVEAFEVLLNGLEYINNPYPQDGVEKLKRHARASLNIASEILGKETK